MIRVCIAGNSGHAATVTRDGDRFFLSDLRAD